MDHHHCHCPPVDHGHHHYSPPPCEQQDSSSWNTPDHCHSPCHPPCPPPPRDDQQDYSWPPFRPTPFPMLWSSSSSDGDVPYCTTVRVEAPAATGGEAPLLESKVHGGGGAAPAPSGTEVLFVFLFWAVVGGFIYWYWFC